MIVIISGRKEEIVSIEEIADVTVMRHVGWGISGAVRVVTKRGGMFHALMLRAPFGTGNERTALFWDRSVPCFAVVPLPNEEGDRMHNLQCECAECRITRFAAAPMIVDPPADAYDKAWKAIRGRQLELGGEPAKDVSDVSGIGSLREELADLFKELDRHIQRGREIEKRISDLDTRIRASLEGGIHG